MFKGFKKKAYLEKLIKHLNEYSRFLIISVENIPSHLLSSVRKELYGRAVIIMGKNSVMRYAISQVSKERTELRKVKECLKGNVGILFTHEDPKEIFTVLQKYEHFRFPKEGNIAKEDLIVPKGITILEPTRTSNFAALEISTKITRGKIEIMYSVKIVRKGERVTKVVVQMMRKLDIKSISEKIEVVKFYDNGYLYEPEVLKLSDFELFEKFFRNGVDNVKSVSISLALMNESTIHWYFRKAFLDILAVVSEGTDFKYTFSEASVFEKVLKRY